MAVEYMFFSSAHESFSMIDHILSHKTSPKQFLKIEMIGGQDGLLETAVIHDAHREKQKG